MLRAIAQIHLQELKPESRANINANPQFTHIRVNVVLSMGIGLLSVTKSAHHKQLNTYEANISLTNIFNTN